MKERTDMLDQTCVCLFRADFWLTIDDGPLIEPRKCIALRRLGGDFKQDLLLVKVTPPLSEDETAGLRCTDNMVLASNVGDGLLPIERFPVHVYALALRNDIPTDSMNADRSNLHPFGLGFVCQTYEDAKARMPLSIERDIERRIAESLRKDSKVDPSFLYSTLVLGPLLVPFWSIEAGKIKLDYYREPSGEVLGCVFSSERTLRKHYVKSMRYVKLPGRDAFALVRDSDVHVKRVIVNPGNPESVVLSAEVVDALMKGQNPPRKTDSSAAH